MDGASSGYTIAYEDPVTWPSITDALRTLLVERGPQTADLDSIVFPVDKEGRHMDKKWFTKHLKNGDRIQRTWMLYSKSKNSLFCFPCLLFQKSQRTSSFSDIPGGFNDWKHLNPCIQIHENSSQHRENYMAWKSFEKSMKTGSTIDHDLQLAIQNEAAKWRNILKVVVDVIIYCAKNNLAFRGSDETSTEGGIFLSTLELVSHYHPQLAAHMAHVKENRYALSYFSPKIQNELIDLIGTRIKREIIKDLKAAKYFSIMFDCTPDTSRKEQMSQIVRFVDGAGVIREHFVDFIHTFEKTGQGLSEEILSKIEADGLDFQNCRGQCYDRGPNMAGKQKGVQARLQEVNDLARFVPCAAHSLNLVGTHAASQSSMMVSFFGVVQQIFNFFSGSTSRWQELISKLGVALKDHSDTRWSSKERAVSALKKNIVPVLSLLKELTNKDKFNNDTVFGASNLIKQIDYKFICLLQLWGRILSVVDKINVALQKHDVTVDTAHRFIDGLIDTLKEMRTSIVDDVLETAQSVCTDMGLDASFSSERKRKRKRFADESEEETFTEISVADKFRSAVEEVFSHMLKDLNKRFEDLVNLSEEFSFLFGKNLKEQDLSELKKIAFDFAEKYSSDVDSDELLDELVVFKNQIPKLISDVTTATPKDLLQCILQYSLNDLYPNIMTSLRIFLTLPATVASCERSFSKLKLIKNYLRSVMGQNRLSHLALISIEAEILNRIDIDEIITDFANIKARKVKF